ncbi:hypothetical protein I4U23_004213 [Adineta vaga]|nr:hypothetical protein I4U23_004213 [Adineta vaga]
MAHQPIYRQHVLFDGSHDQRQFSDIIKRLSQIPSDWDFHIFYDGNNSSVQLSSQQLTGLSHVQVHDSSDPINYEAKISSYKDPDGAPIAYRCAACGLSFQTLTARYDHLNKIHPNALENDDE